MGIWQKRLGKPNPGLRAHGTPCSVWCCQSLTYYPGYSQVVTKPKKSSNAVIDSDSDGEEKPHEASPPEPEDKAPEEVEDRKKRAARPTKTEVKPEVNLQVIQFIQSGSSYLLQDFVMFFHVSCE